GHPLRRPVGGGRPGRLLRPRRHGHRGRLPALMPARRGHPAAVVDLRGAVFAAGAHLLLDAALRDVPAGAGVTVSGDDPALGVHLRAWCRGRGHDVAATTDGDVVVRGPAEQLRWRFAERAGGPGPDEVAARADPAWGLAAR